MYSKISITSVEVNSLTRLQGIWRPLKPVKPYDDVRSFTGEEYVTIDVLAPMIGLGEGRAAHNASLDG